MLEQVVQRELNGGWTVVADSFDLGDTNTVISSEPIAEHDSGAELYVDKLDQSEGIWGISVSQPVTYNNIRASPVTISEQIRGQQYVAKFIRDTCNGIADNSNVIEVIAVVPHGGSVDSIDLSYLSEDTEIEIESLPELIDLFCVYPETLPKRINIDDLIDVREPLVKTVFGQFEEDEELPDTVQELSSASEAYGSIRLETYTVPTSELDYVDSFSRNNE